jgi:tetratricopeptide (TPR) repeat protein
VLHRDLKPSNVMVTPAGRVVLLDFGLAQARGAAKLTRTGAQLGSLHYMAPEQVRGQPDEIDERTDVYAIGVLLYELLALRLPFAGETTEAVARAILAANPERLTRSNSAVSWDVETVCMLAMDPDRAMRYPSATALLRDLRNLLERRPIEARRPSALLRARRFAQRHRAMTTALLVAGFALAATPIVVAVRERGLNLALSQSIVERDREMSRARANVEVASQALNRVLQRLADEDIDQIPDLRGFVEGLLQETSSHLDALLSSNPTEPGACLSLAETLGQAGNLRWRFRDFTRADAALARARELLALHAAAMREEAAERFAFAELDTGLALALLRARNQDVRGPYLAELRRLLGDAPAEAVAMRPRAFRERWASGLERLGAELCTVDPTAARTALQRALAVRTRTAEEFDDVTAWLEVAQSETAFFALPDVRQDRTLRAAHRQRADAALQRAAARPPRDDAERRQIAFHMIVRTQTLRSTDPELASAMLTQAIAHLERAIENRPSRLGTRLDLASAVHSLSVLQIQQRKRIEALASKRRSLDIARPLATSWPTIGQAWLRLLDGQMELVRLLADDPNAADERERLFDSLETDARQALRHHAGTATILESIASALAATAQHRFQRGGREHALAVVAEAIGLSEEAFRLSRTQGVTLGGTLVLRSIHAEILLAMGRKEAALATLQAIGSPLPKDLRQRIPGLDAVADEPGFAELLRAAEGR